MASTALSSNWWYYLREIIISPFSAILSGSFAIYIYYKHGRKTFPMYHDSDFEEEDEEFLRRQLPPLRKNLYLDELAKYNAKHKERRYLIALNHCIYDVSNAFEDFGPNGCYAHLSGTDITDWVKKSAHELCLTETAHIKDWEAQLEANFPIVGVLKMEVGHAQRIVQHVKDKFNSPQPYHKDKKEKTEKNDNDEQLIIMDYNEEIAVDHDSLNGTPRPEDNILECK